MVQNPFFEKALELASRVTHPTAALTFALVLALVAFYLCFRAKKTGIAWSLAIGILVLGALPLLLQTYLASRGIYRVRVLILGLDHLPVDSAHVTSSIGGEPKKVENGWEFDIPPQTRPKDNRVVFFASERSAFLSGTASALLDEDYFTTITVQLSHDTSAQIRGTVVDEKKHPVGGASVSIDGYSEIATTNEMGFFVLPAHVAEGEIVQVRAQKGRRVGSLSVPAGPPVEMTIK